MSKTDTNTTPAADGVVTGFAATFAGELSKAKVLILGSQSAAYDAALYTGLLAWHGQFVQKVPFASIRELLGAEAKASKDNNSFDVERTLAAARQLALYLSKNPVGDACQANSFAAGFEALKAHFSTVHGIRDRKALTKFLWDASGRGDVKKATISDSAKAANSVLNVAGNKDKAFSPGEFGATLMKGLPAPMKAALFEAVKAEYEAHLKLIQDGAAKLAAEGLEGSAPAFAAAG